MHRYHRHHRHYAQHTHYAPSPPPPPLCFQVTSFEDGLRGSWYRASVLSAPSESGTVRVRYAVDGASGPEEEEVAANRLRPLPPELSSAEIKPLLSR